MTEDRLNELLAGALHHPLPMLTMTRLASALFSVVKDCGAMGDEALEEWCRWRDEPDRREGEDV